MLFSVKKKNGCIFFETREREVELYKRIEGGTEINNNVVNCWPLSLVHGTCKCQCNRQLCTFDLNPAIQEMDLRP